MNQGKGGCVYIVTNVRHTVLYTGVTSDLTSRVIQHKEKLFPKSFSAKYNCNKLVYFKSFFSIEEAIIEEKKIKGGSRQDKINRIISTNPRWDDLFETEISKW